jgi:hypothetical protein
MHSPEVPWRSGDIAWQEVHFLERRSLRHVVRSTGNWKRVAWLVAFVSVYLAMSTGKKPALNHSLESWISAEDFAIVPEAMLRCGRIIGCVSCEYSLHLLLRNSLAPHAPLLARS